MFARDVARAAGVKQVEFYGNRASVIYTDGYIARVGGTTAKALLKMTAGWPRYDQPRSNVTIRYA